MPHAVSPEGSPAESSDIELPDAPSPSAPQDGEPSQSDAPSSATVPQPSSPPDSSLPTSKADLEAMMDDGDDDEYNTSSAPAIPQAIQTTNFTDPDLMRLFYGRLFPVRPLFHWLNHSPTPSTDFQNREFAFTLPNGAYLRYQSFPTPDLFRAQLVAMTPSRFEIGPVYSTNPRDRKTLRRAAAFRPVSKELVFDVDMTDYDEIRGCCSGAAICEKCWAFMRMAIRVVDESLREDFGFKHILWVYSGRRGVHAWVCDKRARDMDDAKRRAIAGYLELLKGGDATKKKVNVKRPLHPHIERSLRLLRPYFQTSILSSQDPWQTEERSAHLLSLLPDASLADALRSKWAATPSRSSASKWADIDAVAESGSVSAAFDGRRLLEAKQDIVLEYTYPRLDAAVSKHLNHLLKSPFCVHPKTGRVCVPIDARRVDDFDPFEVPTVTELLGEVDAWRGEAAVDGARKIQDWEKTRLKPYVEYFKGFVAGLLKEEGQGKRRREEGESGSGAMEF